MLFYKTFAISLKFTSCTDEAQEQSGDLDTIQRLEEFWLTGFFQAS
jgi:hypothetical protein